MMKGIVKEVLNALNIRITKNQKYDYLTRKIIHSLPFSSNCIDVGCFKGEIMDIILNVAPEGKHFGIEPIPELFFQLKEKYEKNENCTILNYAASNVISSTEFVHVVSNPSYSGLKRRDYKNQNEKTKNISVNTDLLDNLIPNDLKIDLIKIDVEGAELLVLEGAKRIISKFRPIVIFEHGLGASNYYDSTPDKIFSFFKSCSMNIYNLDTYLNEKIPLSITAFNQQFMESEHYYFVAQ